jgi:hypothetical protein
MAWAAAARPWVTTTSTRWVSACTAPRAPVVASVACAVAVASDNAASAASARATALR